MRLQPQPQPLSRLTSMTMIILLLQAGMDITRKLVMAHSLSRPFHTINPQTYTVHMTRMLVQVLALPALVLVDVAYAMEGSKIHTVLSLIRLSSMRCTRRDAPGSKETLAGARVSQTMTYFKLLACLVVTHTRWHADRRRVRGYRMATVNLVRAGSRAARAKVHPPCQRL